MAQRNLPANCQPQDISNYRFPLLRTTLLKATPLKDHPGIASVLSGTSIVGWLTHDGRWKVRITLANNG